MIRVLSRIPLFWSFSLFDRPHVLPLNYTFSLTFRCNSRCLTCNIWQKKGVWELTADEWQRVFYSLGKSPYWVTLSGGEPFLREDLARIVEDLYRISQPKIVTIPTNGILTDKIKKDVQEILDSCSGTRLIINLSLDGVGEEHDKIRGIEGNFAKAMETYKNLRKIKSPNFVLGVHTVISRENVNKFPKLCDFVLGELKPDSYVTEIAEERVELGTLGKNITPTLKDYKKAVNYLKQKIKSKKLKGLTRLVQAFRGVYYDLAGEILERKTQVIPCYAGVTSVQIAPNGDVWQCCVRADVLGNLKKEGFNFSKIWFSRKASKIRKSIKSKKCYCPLANVSYTNILMSPASMVKVIFNFFK